MKLGAGGYVTGIDMVGTTKVIRTDVGGAYVLNTGTNKWEQLCTTSRLGFTPTAPTGVAATGFDGVYEIRIAPSNSAIIYMVRCGNQPIRARIGPQRRSRKATTSELITAAFL